MKYFISIVLAVCQSIMLCAQNIDYNKIVLPDKVIPSSFEERLVQLAWKNHPSNIIASQNVQIAGKEKKLAQWKWLDDIYANGNLYQICCSMILKICVLQIIN